MARRGTKRNRFPGHHPPPPHLQHVVQGLRAEGLACAEQRVAGLVHLVGLPARHLGVLQQRPLQALAAALKLLAHLLELAHVP